MEMFYKMIVALSVVVQCNCEPGDISRQKCEEYAQYVYQMEDSPMISFRKIQEKVSQCGLVEVPLIIGGTVANPKEFPHLVVIAYGSSPQDPDLTWNCAGSLISDIFVISAKHCFRNKYKAQKVRLGEVNFDTSDESDIQERDIVDIIFYEEELLTKYNDIALVKLDAPVEFTAYVRPACLNTHHLIKEPTAIAVGFGKTSFDAEEGSKHLMKVTLNLFDRAKCELNYAREIKGRILAKGITETMLCVGVLSGGKDACQGDSGGPLQIVLEQPYCMYSIVGIISFGKFCGFANQPAIYTNVSSYISWIEKHVWP